MEIFILNASSFLFNSAGSLLIIYGGLQAITGIILCEVLKKPYNYQQMRKELTDKIVFGLEFFIAADVLETTRHPTQEKLILLGTVRVDKNSSWLFPQQGSFGIQAELKQG